MLPYRTAANFLTTSLILLASFAGNKAASTPASEVNLVGVPGPYSFSNFCRLKTDELWAVGGNGTVQYQNKDGRVQRRITEESLNAVYFVNSKVGWVVGDSGAIFHTEDQGRSWSRQVNQVTEPIRGIKCTSESRCWAVGGTGVILNTRDGQNWEHLKSNVSANLYAVDFIDDQVGWVAGEDGLILHTKNGGSSWQTQHANITLFPDGPFAAPTNLLAIKFVDHEVGWVAGAGGIARTFDGGKTWDSKEIEDTSFIGLVSSDGKKVWAISGTGTNFISRDSGTTWKQEALRQLGQGSSVSEETYNRVLDLVFPRNIPKNYKSRYLFVLRYEPAFSAESQITIAERGGEIEVIKYTSLDGNIENKLNQIVQRTRTEDAKRMARQIRIKKEYVKVPSKDIKLLRESFFEKLRLSEQALLDAANDQILISADGTSYRLWYRGATEVQTDFIGSNITTPTRRDESPLLDWMKETYLKVTTHPATARR
jgi:photosystem II stability/assembly factor-like uncharacterized protein